MKHILERVEKKVDKLDDKMDRLDSKVTKLDIYVEKNTEDLEHHIRRTDLNEDRILRIEKIEQFIRGAIWITLGIASVLVAVSKLIK